MLYDHIAETRGNFTPLSSFKVSSASGARLFNAVVKISLADDEYRLLTGNRISETDCCFEPRRKQQTTKTRTGWNFQTVTGL